jgi:hypothetical protein
VPDDAQATPQTTPEGLERTRVGLEHRNLERFGEAGVLQPTLHGPEWLTGGAQGSGETLPPCRGDTSARVGG